MDMTEVILLAGFAKCPKEWQFRANEDIGAIPLWLLALSWGTSAMASEWGV